VTTPITWHELITTDVEGAVRLYTELLARRTFRARSASRPVLTDPTPAAFGIHQSASG